MDQRLWSGQTKRWKSILPLQKMTHFSTLVVRQKDGWVEVLRWLVAIVGWCTTSDSDTFQPFVAPASQDTRDKTAWKWHFSVGQPVCDIHRFETHSWQPFFPLRWQLTVSNVVPLFVKRFGLTTCGGYWSGSNHIRPWSHSTPLGFHVLGRQNSLFNPKHQITDLKLRGKGGILPRWREMVFCPEIGVQTSQLAARPAAPPKITKPRGEVGFRRSYIYSPAEEFISSDYESRQLR